MEVSIENIKHGDVLEIKKLLSSSANIVATNISREILKHISAGVALKLVQDGKIMGIWCSMELDTYTSLSYFFVHESLRRTLWVLELFMAAGRLVCKTKPVLITTKDTTGFDRYVEKIGDDLYKFKGLR